jgi:hypothetical protein
MKKYLMGIVILLSIVFAMNNYAGNYQSQKFITANWGPADGEFGLIMEAEGNCPQSLTFDKEGNLAILDLVNKRVQLYSSDGKWLGKFNITSQAFDIQFMNDRFILLAPYDYLIEQYNQQGKLIEKVSINRKIGFVDGLRIVGNDIFIQTIEQVQYNMSEKSPARQLESGAQGLSSQITDKRFQTQWIDPHQGYLLMENQQSGKKQTITINAQDELGSLVFLNTDKYGNIYLRKELFAPDGKSYFEVDKLDSDGNVLSTIQIANENIVDPFKPITIDRDGSIYFLEIKSEGFSVIRWQERK